MRVLMVEDEASIARPLERALQREGYRVAVSENASDALELVRSWDPMVVLLDLMLPDMDGTEVARRIRADSNVPIIMVTARADERDRIEGLDIGADDYVVKPFSVDELIARIRAVTRRASTPTPAEDVYRCRDLVLDDRTRKVTRGGTELDLSSKEYELLRILLIRAGSLVRRDEVVRAVWGVPLADAANTLDVHVSWLRKKLGDDARHSRYVETVRGVGYRFLDEEP